MIQYLWIIVAFLSGAIPFSFWLGKLFGKDIRNYGDGNPGAINAWKAAGYHLGIPAILLDYLKGVVPVGLANFSFGFTGRELVLAALAPVLGHAFSPFLRFRGGKAVAVTFGIWTGLTLWEGPTALGILLGVFFSIQKVDGWSVMLAMFGLPAYFLIRQAAAFIFVVWFGNILILAWKHRHDLRQKLAMKPAIAKLLRKEH
jgi:glycerol-3-phosphate acyltransferase PlsY